MGFAHGWPGSYVRLRLWTEWQNSEEAMITSNKKMLGVLFSYHSLERGMISVGETHRLNSVEPAEFSLSFSPIFRNDPLGLLGRPG